MLTCKNLNNRKVKKHHFLPPPPPPKKKKNCLPDIKAFERGFLNQLLVCTPTVTLFCGVHKLKLQNLALPECPNIPNFMTKIMCFVSQNSLYLLKSWLMATVDVVSAVLLTQNAGETPKISFAEAKGPGTA